MVNWIFDSGRRDTIQDTLTGAAGISTWPAGAAPDDGVSLAEAVRATYEMLAQGVATGTADVDVSASDYTTVGGIAFLTITPASTITDVYVDLDMLKTTTGLLVVNTTQTVQIQVQVKIDGTNWRTVQHWPAASSTTGLAVPDAAQDLDALDDSPGHRFFIGTIGATQEARLTIELSAETGGDCEIPFAVYYRGAAPTVTAVAAG
jgi:hypothetical protein